MQDFLKGGGQLKSTPKKGGITFGPNVKKPTSWAKRGSRPPTLPPPPFPGSAPATTVEYKEVLRISVGLGR